jgi:dGTP triphosphohydrolase
MANENELHLILATEEEDPKPARNLRRVVSDAFALVRSQEANRALATVTLEDLIGEVITRYGESVKSNTTQYNPYSYDPSKDDEAPASSEPAERANFIGGFPLDRPNKYERLLALEGELSAVIEEIKTLGVLEVADQSEFTEGDEDSVFVPREI